ncbi:DUF3541 domain-containing protein [Halomonas piscis]|uniref:DUF3541 domain-containing protein n=1 Tax=Halomonas piscis TaxID=3031727 RepID=UPI00289D2B73|nr:DUF3541 domain-containing protein [Halomonas piscis]
MRAISLFRLTGLIFWLLLTVPWAAGSTPTSDTPGVSAPEAIAEAIRARYETALVDLPESKRRHYAQRLYRITGDERYLPLNRDYGDRLTEKLREEIAALATPGFAERRAREAIADYPTSSEKKRRRKRMLSQWGEIAYAKSLAFDLVQTKAYGLLNESDLPDYQRALAYLKSVNFRSFLLDAEVMTVYAAQIANLAYYLHDLGVVDLREEVITAFRQQYPPTRDAALTRAEYRNKIYGMTHLVIAASDYYQKPVKAEAFRWALNEFAAGLDPLLARTKADIYTEVGISFLLAGQGEHPAVTQLQDALLEAYDADAQMIPAEDGSTDLAQGEHRNVLAIMLLDWPNRLYPGPVLYELGNTPAPLNTPTYQSSARRSVGAWQAPAE